MKPYFITTCTFISQCLLGYAVSAQKPSISFFQPAMGMVASPITISGTNFNSIAGNNTVYVGGIKALVTNATSTSLTILAPAGAAYRPISVTVNRLTAYSSAPFLVTFPGGSSLLTSTSLASRVDVPVGMNLKSAGTADLDGDGKMDIVAVAYSANLISVLRNTSTIGIISFSSRTDYTTGTLPVSVSFGDLDGDGKQDLLVVNATANSISVFKNNSTVDSISFLPRIDITTDSLPSNCYIHDVDNDGKPDLICANSAANTLSIFRNTTTAGNAITFAARIDLATGKYPVGIVATDLDGDGMPEIAIANASGASISVMKNRSTPGFISFDTKIDYPNAYQPSVLIAGDMDGDNKTDLVAGSNASPVFSVLKNKSLNGNLSFGPVVAYSTGLGNSTTISLGDANGDGKVDVAANHDFYSTVSLIKNQSRPDTLSFAASVDYSMSSTAASAIQADLDGDGRPDVISANGSGGVVSIFRNTVTKPFITSISPKTAGNGELVSISGYSFTGASAVRFGGVPATSFLVVSSTSITAVVDIGSSGEVTVVTPYGTARIAGLTFSRIPVVQSFTPAAGSTGTVITINGVNFTGATSVSIGAVPAASFSVVSPTTITATIGTLPPGNYDVTVTNSVGTGILPGFYTGVTVSGFYPTSGPAGTPVTILGTHFSNVPSANIVYFGTVRAPVITATSTSLSVMAPLGTSYQHITVTTDSLTAFSKMPFTVTFKSTGNEFTPTTFEDVLDSAVGSYPVHASISDLNNDGKPDVVLVNFASYFISVSQNSSSAAGVSFQRRVNYATGNYPLSTSIGDLDGDGRQDIVVLTDQNGVSFERSITVFRNTTSGDSIQLSPTDYAIGIMSNNPEQSLIADFDSDGKPDIAILSYAGITILKNTSRPGAISFAPKIDFYGTFLGNSISSSDIDGDGKTDLIATDLDIVTCYRNISANGKISFAPVVKVLAGFSPSGISFGDFNNDGREDMAVTNAGNNNVSVYKNISTTGIISFEPPINYPIGVTTRHVAVSDLDGDGRVDIALATTDRKSVTILKNTGSGGTISFATPIEYNNAFNLGRVFVADINVDGKPDLLTNNPNGNSFSVFVNKCMDDGLPAATINAGGPTEVCEGNPVVLKTGRVNGAVYQWYKDGTAIAGANDSVFTAYLGGRYVVKVTINGILSSSAPLNVTIKQVPALPSVQVGGVLCQGSGTLLSSSAKAGNQWYKDNVFLTGSVDSIYRVVSAGIYKVAVTSNGCAAMSSNAITVTVAPSLPAMTSSLASSFCAGDSITFSINMMQGLQYQWNINEEPIPGASSPIFTTKIPGSYSLTTYGNGCNTSSQPMTITRNSLPAKPSVAQNGAEFQSSSAAGNQWYRDGLVIPGATAQIYKPTSNGSYSVQVTVNGCQSLVSEPVSFILTGIINVDNTHFIRLGPNPAKDQMMLEFKLNQVYALNLDLVDLNGRMIQRWTNVKNGAILDVASFSSAIYLVRIYSKIERRIFVLKIVKQ